MKKPSNRRWRFWADKTIQGRLVFRLAIYWATCQFALVGTMVGMSFLMMGSPNSGTGSIWNLIVPGVIVSLLVLPFAIYDLVVFSNRFTGPMMRFRRHVAELAESGTADEIHFRPADFYLDLSENFNKIRTNSHPTDLGRRPQTEKSTPLPALQMTRPMGTQNHV
jgi:hypothetical protein